MFWLYIILGTASGIGVFLFFNWLLGYRKGHIQMDFDERYMNHQAYIEAISEELRDRGYKDVHYKGDHVFIVDGKAYVFFERNVPMGGVPLQRTILKPQK